MHPASGGTAANAEFDPLARPAPADGPGAFAARVSTEIDRARQAPRPANNAAPPTSADPFRERLEAELARLRSTP